MSERLVGRLGQHEGIVARGSRGSYARRSPRSAERIAFLTLWGHHTSIGRLDEYAGEVTARLSLNAPPQAATRAHAKGTRDRTCRRHRSLTPSLPILLTNPSRGPEPCQDQRRVVNIPALSPTAEKSHGFFHICRDAHEIKSTTPRPDLVDMPKHHDPRVLRCLLRLSSPDTPLPPSPPDHHRLSSGGQARSLRYSPPRVTVPAAPPTGAAPPRNQAPRIVLGPVLRHPYPHPRPATYSRRGFPGEPTSGIALLVATDVSG